MHAKDKIILTNVSQGTQSMCANIGFSQQNSNLTKCDASCGQSHTPTSRFRFAAVISEKSDFVRLQKLNVSHFRHCSPF